MIHLNYDGKQNNGIIFNDNYTNGAMYKGLEFKPSLSFEFDSFQYSEVFDTLDSVEFNGIKMVMTEEQATEIKTLATSWIQPLGQEGNPNDEQKLLRLKGAIQGHIDAQAVTLGYDDINSCAKYVGFENPYQTESLALLQWTSNVWVHVEAELVKMEAGERSIPTVDEAIAEITAY